MSAIAFDTHAVVKKLKAAGFTEEQAEAQAQILSDIIDNSLATKRDIKELERSTTQLIKELEYRLTIRLGGMMVVAVGIVATLVKLL